MGIERNDSEIVIKFYQVKKYVKFLKKQAERKALNDKIIEEEN
jgi:6-pyruvoyl-tetrahydropterin synthase